MGPMSSFTTEFDQAPKSYFADFNRNKLNADTTKSLVRQMIQIHKIPNIDDFLWVLK